jgi:hypothetical protein
MYREKSGNPERKQGSKVYMYIGNCFERQLTTPGNACWYIHITALRNDVENEVADLQNVDFGEPYPDSPHRAYVPTAGVR